MRFKIEDVVFRLDVPLSTEVVDAKTYDKREKEYNEAITELSERNHAIAAELSEAKSNNSIWHRRAIQDQDQVRNMRLRNVDLRFQNFNLSNLNNNLRAEVKRQEARADEAEKLYIDIDIENIVNIVKRLQKRNVSEGYDLSYLKEKVDAISQGKQQESGQPEYKDRKGSGQTAEAGYCNSAVQSGESKKEPVVSVGPFAGIPIRNNIPKQDANIEKSKESFKGILYYLT